MCLPRCFCFLSNACFNKSEIKNNKEITKCFSFADKIHTNNQSMVVRSHFYVYGGVKAADLSSNLGWATFCYCPPHYVFFLWSMSASDYKMFFVLLLFCFHTLIWPAFTRLFDCFSNKYIHTVDKQFLLVHPAIVVFWITCAWPHKCLSGAACGRTAAGCVPLL